MAIPRINILQHREFGKLVLKWAREPDSRPKDLAEFRTVTNGILEQPLPSWVKAIQFIQPNKEVLVIRLAPPEFVEDSLATNASSTEPYKLPDFYAEYFKSGLHQDRQEMFEYRVGDYTLALCM